MFSSSLVNATLLPFKHFSEGERLVGNASARVELAHELDPMEAHSVQEDFKGVHHEEDTEDGKHVAEACEEEVEDSDSRAH